MGQSEEVDSRIGMVMGGLIDNLTGGFTNVIPGMVNKTLGAFSDALKDNAVKAWDKTINTWIEKNWLDDDTGAMLKTLRDETFPIGTITQSLSGSGCC